MEVNNAMVKVKLMSLMMIPISPCSPIKWIKYEGIISGLLVYCYLFLVKCWDQILSFVYGKQMRHGNFKYFKLSDYVLDHRAWGTEFSPFCQGGKISVKYKKMEK